MNFKQALSEQSSGFLNLVRLVACEMVVLGHFLTKYQPSPYDSLFRLGSTMGGVAVMLFFALSGLLITYSLMGKLHNPKFGFRCFFVDRFSRIYSGLIPAPTLWRACSGNLFYEYEYYAELTTMQSPPSIQTFGMTALMLQHFPVNFFDSLLSSFGLAFPLPQVTSFGFNGILWTLVLEWWIYMVFGWIVIGTLAFFGRHRKSLAYKSLIVVVAALLCLLLAGMFLQNSSLIVIWFLGAAMMLALASETLSRKLSGGRTALAVLFFASLTAVAFAVYATFAWTHNYYDIVLGVVLSACVFLGIALLNAGGLVNASKLLDGPSAGVFAAGAGFSYTLFLTHYPIIVFLNGLDLPIDRWLMLVPILLLTNLMAFAIAFFTERRHRQLAGAIKKFLHLSVS